jgi:hypothetical protein
LEKIKSYLGVGVIPEHSSNVASYKIVSVKDFSYLIDHLERYPLMTEKSSDYKLFKKALKLIQCKEHLTEAGLQEILAIRAAMN